MDSLSWIILALQILMLMLGLFSKSFIKGWVEGSIAEHFNKASEKRSYEQLTRMKAELVAELMAEWLTAGADRKKLRELTNKAFLWLPKDIAEELSSLMVHDSNVSVQHVLSKVRAHLLNENAEKTLKAEAIISFELTKYEKRIREDNDIKS